MRLLRAHGLIRKVSKTFYYHVTIEHLDLQKKTGIDILQTGDGRPPFVVYDGLFVSRYNDPPFAGEIRCRQLDEKATVLIPCMAGTLHVIDIRNYAGQVFVGPISSTALRPAAFPSQATGRWSFS